MGKGHPPQLRSRQTRSSKGRLLSGPVDPALLSAQLRALGLYAADTLGDGNCLFRALSDQLYGSPSRHPDLRQRICDWIARHPDRYEPFVDDVRGLLTHLRCMRQPGTYGGHLELSAFAHMEQRDVKVVQPGLVYVIEHSAFEDRRRTRREDKRQDKDPPQHGTIYVAYHDWEHFSSIRNLHGPHTGLPLVCESPPPAAAAPTVQKPRKKVTLKLTPDPTTVPLPTSRAASPPASSSSSPAPAPHLSTTSAHHRTHASSPKRALDTTGDESECSASSASLKRSRRTTRASGDPKDTSPPSSLSLSTTTTSSASMDIDSGHHTLSTPPSSPDPDPDPDPDSAPCSSSSSSPSPEPSPPPPPLTKRQQRLRERERVRAEGGERPLTRRQRKALGIALGSGTGAGKIVIPGGRFRRGGTGESGEQGEEEWVRNGTGRLDVRGFRELRI